MFSVFILSIGFPQKIFHLDDIAAESFIKNVQSFFSLLHSSRCFQQQKRKLAKIIGGKAISLSCIRTGPGAKSVQIFPPSRAVFFSGFQKKMD